MLKFLMIVVGKIVRRRVLLIDDNVCVGGYGSLKIEEHLFLGCDIFVSVWSLVLQWMRMSFVAPAIVCNHLLQLVTWRGFRDHHILSSK